MNGKSHIWKLSCSINLLSLQLTGKTIKITNKSSVTVVKFSAELPKEHPRCDNATGKLFSGKMTNLFTFRNFVTGIFTVVQTTAK